MHITTLNHPLRYALAALALLAAPAFADDAPGHNQLTGICATKLSGDRVQIALTLASAPSSAPLSITVNQPARIALDLADTRLGLKDHKTDVQAGMVNSILTAEAAGRSRVVINLTSLVPYATKVDGNVVYVIVGSNAADTAVANAGITSFGPQQTGNTSAAQAPAVAVAPVPVPVPTPSAPAAKPSAPAPQAVASAPAPQPVQQQPAPVQAAPGQIANIDFRRDKDGGGEI